MVIIWSNVRCRDFRFSDSFGGQWCVVDCEQIEIYILYIFHMISWLSIFSPETRLSPWPGKQFFNKECGSELAAGVMYIIYFHASKNGTNLPDVKTYCNKMEQILAKKSDMFQSLQTSSNNKHFKDITLTLKCVKMQTEKYMGEITRELLHLIPFKKGSTFAFLSSFSCLRVPSLWKVRSHANQS